LEHLLLIIFYQLSSPTSRTHLYMCTWQGHNF